MVVLCGLLCAELPRWESARWPQNGGVWDLHAIQKGLDVCENAAVLLLAFEGKITLAPTALHLQILGTDYSAGQRGRFDPDPRRS